MIGQNDAKHLLLRTVFGPKSDELTTFAALSRRQAVARLIGDKSTTLAVKVPGWTTEPPLRKKKGLSGMFTSRKKIQELKRERGSELQLWWLSEMQLGNAFRERLVLMWHNHFTTSMRKVKAPGVVFAQNQTLRRYAFGSFRDLLSAILRDPAMLFYLDNHKNVRKAPNENLSRELLELFTLGEGNYTERDIKEIARALTGRGIDRQSGTYQFNERKFDGGSKTFLGRTGFDGEDVVDAIMSHDAMPAHIAGRVWREFISREPTAAELKRAATVFSRNKFDLVKLYEHVLLHDAFWDEKERGAMIKSPIELIIGTLRSFEIGFKKEKRVAKALRQLGQDPFLPPNVKGWEGGERWINSSSLLRRRQLMKQAVRLTRREHGRIDAPADFILAQAPVGSPSNVVESLLDPTYQLK